MRRLLAVHAHPDDESSKGAATLVHYRLAGAAVMVVSCTGGEAGSVLNPALPASEQALAERDMAELRRREMAAAARILGIEHRWLGFRDSDLPPEGEQPDGLSFAGLPLEQVARPLARLISRWRPQVVVAYGPDGGYPHPDHIRAHEATVRAIADAAAGAEDGRAWQVSKFYYDRSYSYERQLALLAAGAPMPAMWRERLRAQAELPHPPVTARVRVADGLRARDAALRAHVSQVEPASPFFFAPDGMLERAWPTDEYELVWSKVPVADVEDDLFAGVPD
jgi:mycothiol S-conjugate amidase